MGFFREGPINVRHGGWFLVAAGTFLLYFSFVSPLLADYRPSLYPSLLGCVFGVGFFGTGLPFALFGDSVSSTFGHPQKPATWSFRWSAALVAIGLVAFCWLRWHVAVQQLIHGEA